MSEASARGPDAVVGRMPQLARWILGVGAIYLLLYAAWGSAVQRDDPASRLALNLAFLVAPVAATWSLAGAAWRSSGRARLGWWLISASTGFWTLGQITWATYDMRNLALDRPSLADLWYGLTIPFAIGGLMLLWDWRVAKWFGARAALEGLVLGMSLFIPMWLFVLRPAEAAGQAPGLLHHVYPISGVLILTASMLILPRVNHIDWRQRLLLGSSVFCITAGNSASLLLATTASYHIGHPIDLLWLGGFVLLAAFAAYGIRPADGEFAGQQATAGPSLFTYAMVGMAIVAGAIDVAQRGNVGRVVFMAGTALVGGLIALQRLAQLDARTLTLRVSQQRQALGESNERLQMERQRLEAAQRVAGLTEWEWEPRHGLRTVPDARGGEASFVFSLGTIHPDDLPSLVGCLEDARSGRVLGFDLQVRLRESTRWLRVWTEPSAVGAGQGLRGLVQDITPLKELERGRFERLQQESEVRRLKEVDQMRSTFINVAAHELNTPLTPIKIQLEILRQTRLATADPDAVRSFEILDRNVHRLANLVVDLLDSGRLQSGRMQFRMAPLDLADLAADAIESGHATAQRAQVSLFFESEGALPVHGDARRLQEVLDNLLTNAMKFTPPGGRIDVSARREGGAAVVRVRDSGIGLTSDGLRALFQPFSQVERPVRRQDSGSGLGLFIARGIAVSHGGNVEASSDGPGRGSAFTVRLPLSTDAQVTRQPLAALPRPR